MTKFYRGNESIEIIDSTQFSTGRRDVLVSVSPAYAKLQKLDIEQRELDSQFKEKIVTRDKYRTTCNVIDRARDKAITALDKEEGRYISPAQLAKQERERIRDIEIDYLLKKELTARRIDSFKQGMLWLGCVCGIVLCLYVPSLSFAFILGLIYLVKRGKL